MLGLPFGFHYICKYRVKIIFMKVFVSVLYILLFLALTGLSAENNATLDSLLVEVDNAIKNHSASDGKYNAGQTGIGGGQQVDQIHQTDGGGNE